MLETQAVVLRKRALAADVYELMLGCERFEEPQAGQFLNLGAGPEFTLKRPFGIVDWNREERTVTCAFRVIGKGTAEMARWKEGEKTQLTVPLGHGFAPGSAENVWLVGGGIGVFPLLSVFRSFPNLRVTSFLGYANAENAYYREEFANCSERLLVASDDGSVGRRGFVTDLVAERLAAGERPDLILACGPRGMFASLKKLLLSQPAPVPCQASAEERMGCGIGACLVCACRVRDEDGESHARRVCKDGPVFDLYRLEV